MNDILISKSCNYIGAFLTFSCNLNCSYCINRYSNTKFSHSRLSGREWVSIFNRIKLDPSIQSNLPITLQGGEPTLHPDFYEIVNGIRPDLNIDLLTNLQFDVKEFMKNVHSNRLCRSALYASIRVSYHPETMRYKDLFRKTLQLLDAGYSIGIWAVLHPEYVDHILEVQTYAKILGIDFRTKEFLGIYNGKLYGAYKYDACNQNDMTNVQCKTSELLIGPNGRIYKCHHDLYKDENTIDDMFVNNCQVNFKYRDCSNYGQCNPCDIKLKYDRFQKTGHCSVDIKMGDNNE